MLRSLYRTAKGVIQTDLDIEHLAQAIEQPEALLWLDLDGEPDDVCEPVLREVFGFHPLAVDDALKESHVPKVDDWGNYLLVVLHAATLDKHDSFDLQTIELDAFLGANYLVTHQTQPVAAVHRLWAACQRDERHMRKGSTYLLYTLADELVADYMPVVDEFDDAIDHIEEQLFSSARSNLLAEISSVKRALIHLRRIITPQREALNRPARADYSVIDADDKVFFRDVYDHLVRLHDILASLLDLLSGTMDTYHSVVNNRTNEVMRTLTIITTLFMPVSFLVGFFGMNFFEPSVPFEAWTGQVAFGAVMTAMILVPLSIFLWIRRRAWM